jgi:hypothetical protein
MESAEEVDLELRSTKHAEEVWMDDPIETTEEHK